LIDVKVMFFQQKVFTRQAKRNDANIFSFAFLRAHLRLKLGACLVVPLAGALVCFLLFLSACEELERTNPLDPRNPNSERRQVVLVEAFINTATPFSDFAIKALDSLALAFPLQQVVIVEYHLSSVAYPDASASPANLVRYNNLTAATPAVPDVFFNGFLQRVQGASSVATALLRYRRAVQNEIDKIAHFTLAAQKTTSATNVAVDVTVARLGSENFENFIVGAIAWEDLGAAGRHHVVRQVLAPENFSGIAAGEKKSVRLAGALAGVSNAQRVQVVVIVERATSRGREVLQAVLAE
jgi:hypothetical protein